MRLSTAKLPPTLALAILCCLPSAAAPRAAPALRTVTGPGWSAAFSAGVLVRLTNRLTGERAADATAPAGLAGIRRDGAISHAADEPGAVPRPAGAASTDVAWPDGLSLHQSAALDGGDLVVRQEATAKAPPLAGVRWGIAGIPSDVEVIVPAHSGLHFGPGAPDGQWSFDYPIAWEAQCVLLQGKRGGFLVYSDDTAPQFKTLTLSRRGGGSELSFTTYAPAPFSAAREVRSAGWHLRPYRGSWLVGAALYRRWMEKAFGVRPDQTAGPAWAASIRAVVIVPVEMELLDELARRLDPRQTLLYVPGWRRDGYDRNYPDYTASDDFGPWCERAHALGFRVMPHVNYFGCDPLNPLYAQFRGQQMRDPFTNAPLWWTWDRAAPPIKFAYINPASRAWRALFVARMKEVCARYHVDALHLDQTLCLFNDNNGLVDGQNSMQGSLALHRELREALPDVALSGEGLDEITYRWEAFAQRHLFGLNHADGTWSDRLIALAHPISSALLTPHTQIYGYLGMANPSAGGLYQAWLRGYDHFGVLPTLAHTSAQQLRQDGGALAPFFAEARFWQRAHPAPDFADPWPAGTLFRWRLEDGSSAFRRRDQGSVLCEALKAGGERVISRRIEGVASAALPGSIPGWRAYDGKQLLGLDPAQSYSYLEAARDPKAFHLAALPAGAVVRRVGLHPGLATVSLDDSGAEVARLWEFAGPAHGGVRLAAGGERRYAGAVFSDDTGANATPESDGIFLHPPWRPLPGKPAPPAGKALGQAFLEYRMRLPDRPGIRFESGVCLREGAVGKSDGVTFSVEARAGSLRREARLNTAGADPTPLTLDLSSFRGKEILLRLQTDPGPKGDPAFDWAIFRRPRVVVAGTRPAAVAVVSPAPVLMALGPEGSLPLAAGGPGRYTVRAPFPGTLHLLFAPAPAVSLPLDLGAAPRTVSLVSSSGVDSPPSGYLQAAPQESTVAGISRPALGAHPPPDGRMVIDYVLHLPAAPARFEAYAGIRDGSRSTGVGFGVLVNGRSAWSARMLPNQAWKPVQVDLSADAGKTVVLTLVTDSLGDYSFDWASWGEPRVVGGAGE